MPAPRTRNAHLLLHLLLAAVVVACGALEAWFGRPELFGDDIAYLDVSNLIQLGQWKDALNPQWSIGYPLLLSGVRHFFPAGIGGTLHAVFALNLLIHAAGWVSLLWFLKTAATFLREISMPESEEAQTSLPPYVLAAAACIYLVIQIGFGRVSTVGPDELVTALFFLAVALLLKFCRQPSVANGIRLGMLLGIGYVVKAIFLPIAVIVLATALFPFRRRLPRRAALSASAALLLIALPYAAALSWAIGRPTIGESGSLNYAYHVNQLPHWMGWQGGGDGRLGAPAHPVHLLRDHPAVFGFGEPFHVTYPPQYNLHYWYDGYRHFFSPLNALRAIGSNLHALEAVLHENLPMTVVLLFAIAALLYPARTSQGEAFRTRLNRFTDSAWPIYLPALLGIALYVQVHLEGRYVAPFLAILVLLPFLASRKPALGRQALILCLLLFGTYADLYPFLRLPVRRALAHADMQTGGQWTIAHYLTQTGFKPGDSVASVTTLNDIRCTWAYAAGLHIVADIGNDAYDPKLQHEDFNLFWTDPGVQRDVLRLFREQGAVAVIAPDVSPRALALNPAWQHIPDSNAWLLRIQ